ncbi:hypothetical protein N7532_002443 [Penicillium argentinense]|uniref:Uncharacterized protein n=1 Tax=Penicillium argentinense TaxID=1131581 RepID=A0A9W9KLG8_9EURO|nr:uncharacterized protein N7532_002443 [Penicillium argentinense]KAJ5109798.1 hypothetical protein N7532_002443 [Penicillium argentinense]
MVNGGMMTEPWEPQDAPATPKRSQARPLILVRAILPNEVVLGDFYWPLGGAVFGKRAKSVMTFLTAM